MTEEQRAELEKLARAYIESRAAFMALPPEKRMEGRPDWWVDYRAFADAAGPATVLDLLATIARLEAEAVKDGEALEPFAAACLDRESQNLKTLPGGASVRVTLSQCRGARARLSSRAKDQS